MTSWLCCYDVIIHAYFPDVQNDTKRLSISTLIIKISKNVQDFPNAPRKK